MAEEQSEQAVIVRDSESEVKDRGLFDFLGRKKVSGEEKAEEEYLAAGVQNIHIEEGYIAHEGKNKEHEDLQEFFEKSEEKKEDEKLQEVFFKSEEKKTEDEKHHRVLDKLHRSHSSGSSSSSSDEEEVVEGEGGVKEKIRKKKKALKEKIEGIVQRGEERHEEEKKPEFVPSQPAEESKLVEEEFELHESAVPEGEKKGFLEKIKEKLPGHGKKPAEEGAPVLQVEAVEVTGENVKVYEAVEGPEAKEKKGFLGKIIEKLPGYHKTTAEEIHGAWIRFPDRRSMDHRRSLSPWPFASESVLPSQCPGIHPMRMIFDSLNRYIL